MKAACSRKDIRFLALMEESACKSVAVVKVNNQIFQSLMLQNATKKFGGACMERMGRVIANKRVLQFQFPKVDVLSTSMTAKITSLFFFFCPFPVSNSYKCHQQHQQETSTEGRM